MSAGSLRAALAAAVVTAAFATSVAGATAAGPAAPQYDGICRTASAKAVAGQTVTLALDCRTASRGVLVGRVVGTSHREATAVLTRPRLGVLGKLNRRSGRIAYTANPGAAGKETIRFRVRASDGRRYRGAVVVRIGAAPARPTPPAENPPVPPGEEPPAGDGLPPKLPDAVPGSVASTTRAWVPTAYDSCSKELHDRFSVVGPDGRRYPTWHPPTIVDPASGERCSFGHEHGEDPRGSDLYEWVVGHFAAAGYEQYAGLPFGLAAEALNSWAVATPGTATRSEDHVGYKMDVANDVDLIGPSGAANGVTCDFLTMVHQGSHSPDALSNNAHELLYASRCDDGTEVISSTLSRFGDPGAFQRSCEPGVEIATTDNGYPDGGGSRLIPDRTCVERDVLVGPGKTTSVWALYEKWSSENALETAAGETLAAFPTAFGVFNPSRYGAGGATTARTLPLCWETAPDGDRADGVDCTAATQGGALAEPFAWEDPKSPFDGTRRDFYIWGTVVSNAGGEEKVWTDPYGGNASPLPFPGAICQLVSSLDNAAQSDARMQVFGRNRSFDAEGVHAPN